jgi:hypothetical protein
MSFGNLVFKKSENKLFGQGASMKSVYSPHFKKASNLALIKSESLGLTTNSS